MSVTTTVKSLEQKKWGNEIMLPFAGKVKISEDGLVTMPTKIAEQVVEAMPNRFCNEKDYDKMSKEVTAKAIAAKPIDMNLKSPPLSGSPDFIRGLREGIKQSIGRLQEADKFLEAQEEVAIALVKKEQAEVDAPKVDAEATAPKQAKVKEADEDNTDKAAEADTKANEEKAAEKKATAVAKVNKMTKDPLQDICKRANKPEEEWGELTVPKLKEYVINNIL